jgi:hypothetical protein
MSAAAASLQDAMALLQILNFRDLEGLCRCPWFDKNVACPSQNCSFFHRGQDCIQFTATGSCENGEQCGLKHQQHKHDYCKQHPLRRDITPAMRAVWDEMRNKKNDDGLVFAAESDVEKAWLDDILSADKQMKMTVPQLQAIHELVRARGVGVLQQLERLFRKNNMCTWILARRFRDDGADRPTGCSSCFIDGSDAPYHVFLSVRFAHDAIGELLVQSTTYAENFDKLLQTGFIIKK